MINTNRCSLCQHINLDTIVATGISLPLQPHLTAWQSGLDPQRSCGLCALITHSLRPGINGQMDTLLLRYNLYVSAVVVAATTKEFEQDSALPALLCLQKGESWIGGAHKYQSEFSCAFLNLYCGVGEGEAINGSISHRLRSTNAGSDDCLRLAGRWLDACTTQHGKRCGNGDVYFVPTRLIDVSPELGAGDGVKLVSLPEYDSLGNPTWVKYAALSYCWGTESFLTTTSSNVKAMRQSISLSQLPRTIQDAIRITRYMGLKYLWVDSLCILQGTDKVAQQDWLAESCKMGTVYQSAHFTISAESASAATVGILNDRPAPRVNYYAIPKSEGDSDTIYLGPHPNFWPTTTEPLHQRGWALQESTLSNRLLRFRTNELSWRCSHGEEFESRCEGHDARSFSSFSILDMDAAAEQHPMAEPGDQAREIYDKWTDMVEGYSRRFLTKKPDKLPAIVGLARVAQTATGDGYAAGIWHQNACQHLLWMHARGKRSYARLSDFRAPSWSWASVEGSVCFLRNYTGMTEVDVKFLAPKHRADEGFDRSHSQLYVKGPVVRMSSIRRHQLGAYYGGFDNFSPWTCLPTSLETCLDCLNDIPPRHTRGKESDPNELVESDFLFLAESKYQLGAGLIILPVTMGSSRYRRIGMFRGFPLEEFRKEQRRSTVEKKRAKGLKALLGWNNDDEQKKFPTHEVVLI